MSTEIATWNMICSKIPTFPSPSSGRGNECLTKAEIQSLGGESLSINGNYGNSECVILDDILPNKIIWVYTFLVSPPSLSFSAIGGTQEVSVTSYKEKKINDMLTGIRENVGFSSSPSEGWLSSGGTSVTASENTVTSRRSGSVMYTQHERGTTIPVSVWQDPAVITYGTESDGFMGDRVSYNYGSYNTTGQIFVNKYINGKYNGRESFSGKVSCYDYDTNMIVYANCGILSGNTYRLDYTVDTNMTNRIRLSNIAIKRNDTGEHIYTITVRQEANTGGSIN